jgi:hypothetical protein
MQTKPYITIAKRLCVGALFAGLIGLSALQLHARAATVNFGFGCNASCSSDGDCDGICSTCKIPYAQTTGTCIHVLQ